MSKPPKPRKKPLIKCAECANCKTFKQTAASGRYILKARCAKGHWRKGKMEITSELHRVAARRRDTCPDYLSTSDDENDRKRFIGGLANFLPFERHIFNPDGTYVDKTETMAWDGNT